MNLVGIPQQMRKEDEKEKHMKISILNGSPRKENTAAMVDAFAEGAREAGHEVDILHVGRMNIAGCKGCEYCHGAGEGQCIQKDDFEKVLPAYQSADMVVFATPVYYFDMTAQLAAAIQRVYCIGKPAKATKAAMLVSSGSPGTGEGAIASYKAMAGYIGIEDLGVCALAGAENKDEAKLAEIREFARGL